MSQNQTRKNQLSQKEREIVRGLDPETKEKIMTPRNDLIFKKLFGSIGRETMIKDFLEAILDIKIESVTLGNETILLPEEIDEKTGILDVRVTLEDGSELDIEMQNGENSLIIKRSHFYLSRLYQKKIHIGDDYDVLRKAVVIFITGFDIFPKIEQYHTKWLMTEQQNKEIHFDEMELHFIELPKFLQTKYDKTRKIDQWLLFIDYTKKELIREIMEENENVREAEENLERLKKDEHAQYLAWLREKQILDMNSMKKDGLLMGRKEGIKGVAIRMLKAQMDIEIIIQATGLTKNEIEKIEEEIKNEKE